jgi:hypothetical protein
MATYTWEFGSDAEGLAFTIVYDDVTKQFTVTVQTGSMNLNALYWNDGDTTASGSTFDDFTGDKSEKSLNMNGTGEVWDGGIKVSDAGLGNGGEGYVAAGGDPLVIDATNFDPANFETLGVRATSTSTESGSIKWVEDPVEPEEPDDHFPEWDVHSISHVTFYFDTAEGDVKPNPDGDGWFTVKFDDNANLSDDLDDWFDDAMAQIAADYPDLDLDTLAGVSIKGGTDEVWYDLDNDPDDVDTPPDVWTVENNEVDVAYSVIDSDPFTVA